MVYTFVGFYIFVLILLLLYYLMPMKIRWVVLLAGSVLFYLNLAKDAWPFLAGTIVLTYLAGRYMEYLQERHPEGSRQKKAVLILAVILVAAPWFCIKSGDFLLTSILHRPPVEWIVPIGISFYTLQSIAYLADVYRGKIRAQQNIAKYALFLLFFPQIIQGPIPRYEQLAEQLYQGHALDEEKFVKGFQLIIWGFFLKFVIADKAAVIVNEVFAHPGQYGGFYVLIAGSLYSIELYTDFMACTTLSRGVAGLFGIELTDNFMRPYLAVSIKDFWRRWHISLSAWLRDYIYIPLGGSRKGKPRKYMNLIVTFLVSGIWHGAGYKFLFWGLLHALYQIAGELTAGIQDRIYCFLRLPEKSRARRVLQRVGVFFWAMLAWIIFRADSLREGLLMIKNMFCVYNPWVLFNNSLFTMGLDQKEWRVLIAALAVLMFVGHRQESGICIRDRIMAKSFLLRCALYLTAMIGIMLFGTYGFGFDAQAFIYQNF